MGAETALQRAVRHLAARDLSLQSLVERLVSDGYSQSEAADAVEALHARGLLDDGTLARHRAELLADRGLGDEVIAARLLAQGIGRELVDEAVLGLPPERERACAVVSTGRRSPRQAAALLSRRGFSEDSIEVALASACEGELG